MTYEVFIEREGGGIGFGHRRWHRYRDNPSILVPQFDLTKRDTVVEQEPYTEDELKAMRATLPASPTPIPDTKQEIFPRPSW